MFNKNIIFLLLFILCPENAYSYFDPGSGSYLVQLIIAFIASCFVFFKNPIMFIKQYFKKNKKKEDNEKFKDKSNS
tara:strand:+ start:287 stop:514 length:228 start_codon:yes stop_codon:yes gene_type:complete